MMTNPQLLMAFGTVLGELACYKAEYGELAGQTEYRCSFCNGSTSGPAQLDPALGVPTHSECFLKHRLEDREKEIVALRAQLADAEKK